MLSAFVEGQQILDGSIAYTPSSLRRKSDFAAFFHRTSYIGTPMFEHRGPNFDIPRYWIPPEDALRTIDAMALNKLNKLYLHCTDIQSWPLGILALPSLTIEGAYREDQICSFKDLYQVQYHGLCRGVEVYLEIDLPGHTTSIHQSHPHPITAYN